MVLKLIVLEIFYITSSLVSDMNSKKVVYIRPSKSCQERPSFGFNNASRIPTRNVKYSEGEGGWEWRGSGCLITFEKCSVLVGVICREAWSLMLSDESTMRLAAANLRSIVSEL